MTLAGNRDVEAMMINDKLIELKGIILYGRNVLTAAPYRSSHSRLGRSRSASGHDTHHVSQLKVKRASRTLVSGFLQSHHG